MQRVLSAAVLDARGCLVFEEQPGRVQVLLGGNKVESRLAAIVYNALLGVEYE